jgi:hypothetical protein
MLVLFVNLVKLEAVLLLKEQRLHSFWEYTLILVSHYYT